MGLELKDLSRDSQIYVRNAKSLKGARTRRQLSTSKNLSK